MSDRLGVVKSEYLRVVQELVPPRGLEHRAEEIAALRAFSAGTTPYGWWQGDAWAGKSALLASFVLDPPPDCVVMCYFISRRSGRNTHTDFTDTLLDQLLEFTGETVPAALSEHQRDEQRRKLLELAVVKAVESGRHLVLVIDGLDEDAAHLSPGLPEIAGMLPNRPPAGLRIIVASRPATPVPVGHPLKTCPITHLKPSLHATEIRDRALGELREFLREGGLRRDIVGFLAAAQGGLTDNDLAELVGAPPYTINDQLHGSRIIKYETNISDTRTEHTYVLGHEDLVTVASQVLNPTRSTDPFWNRIHDWADHYRDHGWPQDTPSYLLRGYAKRLAGKARTRNDAAGHDHADLERLTQLALDYARHDRMLDITGGDAAAFAEIRDAHQIIAETDDPDLRSAYRLAQHRDFLTNRNNCIPPELPALWYTLGQPRRADALAAALPEPTRTAAYLELASAAGRLGHSTRTAEIAETIMRATTDPDARTRALAIVAEAVGAAGDHARAVQIVDQAEAAARTVTDPDMRAWALAIVAEAVGAAGDHARAV
ncbi:hypothetical protein, partial [Mycolicibacterium sp.]|uniref:hypothetical protein n=1 Tax=Mycolicibacterium sp. TaxID=2320850 RepID=UPI0037C70F04